MTVFGARRRIQDLEAQLAAFGRSQAVIAFGLDGTILEANGNFLRTMGYELGEIVGRHHAMFMPKGEREGAAYRQFWADLRGGAFRSELFRRVTKAGAAIWLQASYNPVLDAAGRPVRIIKIATDVTEARRLSAEAAGQLAAIGRSQAVVEFDLDGTILSANENFLGVMGYELGEVSGQHHRMFVPERERMTAEYRALWAGLARGEFKTGEFKRLAKGGRPVWLHASYEPILDPGGRPFKVMKFGADVTAARLESANNLGQIEAIHRSQAVIEFALDGTILAANENFLAATGYGLDELVGRHHRMFVDPAERESAEYTRFWQDLAGGAFRSGEFQRTRKDGRALWLRATYNAILDPDGTPLKVVKFASDITDQVVAREQFNDLIESVTTSARELSAPIAEITSAMARSLETARAAVGLVGGADEATARLNAAAQAMGRVVGLINTIAEQINLLALNATIEASRAGEAGKGFAVVASEVKTLARRARSATDEIAREIEGVRAVSSEVVASLSAIKEAIDSVGALVTSTATAVEAQSAVTGSISGNMQTAAERAGGLWAA